jgi:hypothetical protein
MRTALAPTIGTTTVEQSQGTTTITVSGTATPKTNLTVWVETLAGVPIEGSERTTTSDEDGNFSVVLSFPTPSGGNYNVCVRETNLSEGPVAKKRVFIPGSE